MKPRPVLAQTLAKYRRRGVLKGSDLLLTPIDALGLIADLSRRGVVVLGIDGWHYVDRDRGWIVQELETDVDVPEAVLAGANPAARSAEIATEFVTHGLGPTTEFVSLVVDTPWDWTGEPVGG